MDYEKKRLTPVTEPACTDDTPAKKQARAEIKRARESTAQFKQRYFETYDDVKISHREDW